jgi:hypothetical protein
METSLEWQSTDKKTKRTKGVASAVAFWNPDAVELGKGNSEHE